MGPFELNHRNHNNSEEFRALDIRGGVDNRRVIEENIIAQKIYDFCRRQECLDQEQLGNCRASEPISIGGINVNEGDVIPVPHEASSVTMDKLRVSKVMIISKEPSSFKKGYWDIELKFVFKYKLLFREEDGCIIGEVKAYSNYTKRVSLFGSDSSELFIATDMYSHGGESILGVEPFVNIEAKPMNLGSKICTRHHHGHDHREIDITIGLFYIVKLFRIVDLSVQSKGFAIPSVCEGGSSIDACDFFGNLAFPMDIFAPPQKPEYFAGISGDIPPHRGNSENHGHGQVEHRGGHSHGNNSGCNENHGHGSNHGNNGCNESRGNGHNNHGQRQHRDIRDRNCK
ncbi:MAG: hypothetical protein FWF50_05970 [Defluviitaleaceae bacterium]|nr:hypothetical protein [Defluviitaleaceae bacterium]